MKNENKLTKKDIAKAAWTWMFFPQSSHNYERMMGTGFAHTMSKPLEKLYKDDDEGLKDALKRNLTFFNTEPQLGSIIPGIALALEETYANDEEFDPEIIASTKNALMGPVAGIGDSILVGTLNPILLSIGIGLSAGGSPIGPLVFLFSWLAIVVTMKYWLFVKGYALGLDAVKILTDEKTKRIVTTALTMIGLIVIGGVASSTVQASIGFEYVSGDMSINIQEILDRILPNFMPLIVALVSYYLVDKKGWSTNKLLLGILAFAAVMVLLGIMG
ncbi:PTS system mannose/fructose/sorbose family transporter subunit IID [Marinilactibacillus sp. XAAS-LB27]|uniref:PTS system mannose/fructose/sorbose family transporter subunit IID n=1 Tax=Marinilactibacillus sp. XAAS-LB27 TaxID=3114538 RepID=UPI002E174E06|nr:PTS system mannose/fructose/sorbose family transporter subunit IID [Marinilactibacillus sp. XAAS-LB27]